MPFKIREQICKLVRLHGLPIWAITKEDPNKEVPYDTLKKQNTNRKHIVPQKNIDKMMCKLEIPTVKEAHDVEFVITH